MFLRIAYLGGALLAGLAPVYANECLAPPSTIKGQLRIVESTHPDGTPIRAFVVFVEDGQCVSIEDLEGIVRMSCFAISIWRQRTTRPRAGVMPSGRR